MNVCGQCWIVAAAGGPHFRARWLPQDVVTRLMEDVLDGVRAQKQAVMERRRIQMLIGFRLIFRGI